MEGPDNMCILVQDLIRHPWDRLILWKQLTFQHSLH